ncbi:hypothetical protein LNV09_02380 [Paucibacter sp. B2R-40]|uniref:hypothetical protein n=1 Tax=Paucibacter sp. B2R-40 TaxID=2893554 RepID=UPI0021E4EC41|nr:hypothetical protein [Paucibacter sp. B2R-40]MCV2353003.1 hypothetical protein [Paucibacter sp. B2R-40]
MKRPLSLTVGLAFGLALLGTQVRAELIEIQWNEAGRFEHAKPLAPGKFVEICGKLDKTRPVSWQFGAERPLNFNIHFHEGEKVTYPAKVEGATAASGLLKIVSEHDYCWMWSNKSDQAIELKLSLSR